MFVIFSVLTFVGNLFLLHLAYALFDGLCILITCQQFIILSGIKLSCSVNKINFMSTHIEVFCCI